MRFLLLLLLTSAALPLSAQRPNLPALLGYSPTAKLLIIHADDLAVTHSENAASFFALESGIVNSGSIMAPCPWLPEVADWVRRHPEHDLGMHLTLTSEWGPLKWGPVAGAARVPSLVDSAGYFYADCTTMAAHARPEEVQLELRAQIERALALGITPTHLDTHMGCLVYTTPAIFQTYLNLSREYGIPALLGARELADPQFAHLAKMVTVDDLVVDRIYTATPSDYAGGMKAYYRSVLLGLPPGTLSTLLIHCAHDAAESRAAFRGHDDWGAHWRKADVDFFTDPATRRLLEAENIKLVTWREIDRAWRQYRQAISD